MAKVSDEKIIAALLQHGTIKEAAKAAGVSVRTIYDRMQDMKFTAAYMEANNDVLRKAITNLNKHIGEAINTVAEIINNPEVNPATRLQAAQTMLSYIDKYTNHIERTNRKSIVVDYTYW